MCPDIVESLLDIGHDFDHRPQQGGGADAGQQTAPGLFQQGAGVSDDPVDDLLLAGELSQQLLFKHMLEAETLGNGKGHGDYRNNGQKRIKG